MNCLTTSCSSILDSTGVIEIGRKSESVVGRGTLAFGRIYARFHCDGGIDADSDRLNRFVIGSAKNTDPSPSLTLLLWDGDDPRRCIPAIQIDDRDLRRQRAFVLVSRMPDLVILRHSDRLLSARLCRRLEYCCSND